MDCMKLEQNRSLVRVFHASTCNLKVDIFFNDKKIYEDISFREISKYIKVKPGKYKVDVCESGNRENVVIRESVSIDPEEIYTIAIVGEENLSLLVINDYFSKTISEDYSSFRVINLIKNDFSVNVYVDDDLLFKNIGYKEGTIYTDVNINEYSVKISKNNEVETISKAKINFKSCRIYTLYLLKNKTNITIIQSVDGNTYICH